MRAWRSAPDGGDILWHFHKSPDARGSGGELQIHVDAETHPNARTAFAKYTLCVAGALPIRRHA